MPLSTRTVLACFLLGLSDAGGIVVSQGSPSGDSSAASACEDVAQLDAFLEARFGPTPAFPYWQHVGTVGMGTGVYLGDGHVLTSAHVGCHPFEMADGFVYRPDYDSWRVLGHSRDEKSDVAIFKLRIQGGDNRLSMLGAIPVSSAPPRENQPVVMIGSGYIQNPKPNTISSNGKVLANLGYRIDLVRRTLWGVNVVSELPSEPVRTQDQYRTSCFATTFERNTNEGQATDGDSGGAIFTFNRSLYRWELTGCILAVSQKDLFVPYGSRTYLADLSAYQDQFPVDPPSPDVLVAENIESMSTGIIDRDDGALPLTISVEAASVGEGLAISAFPPSADAAPWSSLGSLSMSWAPLPTTIENLALDSIFDFAL